MSMRLLAAVLILLALPAMAGPYPAAAPDRHDPSLPNVLIIGDSISIGYTDPTRQLLRGQANVYRIPGNAGATEDGLAKLDDWIGDRRWHVIHFNWGLHDLLKPQLIWRLRWPRRASLAEYASNLRVLVQRLKRSGAVLIFASTTPIPARADGRDEGSEVAYNLQARMIMVGHGVVWSDLHALAMRHPSWQLPHNVHFTDDGSAGLAEQVADMVRRHLPGPGAASASYDARPALNPRF